MRNLCCLLVWTVQFVVGMPATAQTQMIKRYLHGDWVMSHHYFSYDGSGEDEIRLALEAENFTLISFNAFNDSFLIRQGKDILHKGLYTTTFAPLFEHIPHCDVEVVFIDLRKDKSKKLEHIDEVGNNWDYLILTPDMRIASRHYAPGFCASWEYFSKIGWGFINITCNTGNLRYMSNLINSRQQAYWVEKKKHPNNRP